MTPVKEDEDINKFSTVANFAKKNKSAGCWPGSATAIWGIRADTPHNGFGEAFVTYKSRVLIDEKKFWECLRRASK